MKWGVVGIVVFVVGLSISSAYGSGFRCAPPRGFSSATARGVTCHRADEVLKRALRPALRASGSISTEGWRCRLISHAPGGQGFPLEMSCTKLHARINGYVFDGPS